MPRKLPTDKKGNIIKPDLPDLHFDPTAPPTKRYSKDSKDGKITLISQRREYELITPLMGGGVVAKVNDPVTMVNGKSIRGQLRFWWRACRAASFSSLEELKKEEDKIWGSTEIDSAVNVHVENIISNKKEIAFTLVAKQTNKSKLDPHPAPIIAAYASFPLLPNKEELKNPDWKSPSVAIGVKFTLIIRYPKDVEKDVAAALWAWETFGGIGARTRRGFGAIRLIKVNNDRVDSYPDDPKKIEINLRDNLKIHVSGMVNTGISKQLSGIPKLNNSVKIAFTSIKTSENGNNGCLASWHHLIDILKEFRQSRYGSKHGQSKWPEANAIRNRINSTKINFRFSDKVPATNQKLINKFPRAVFGLPLLFHLPHDDNYEVTLLGANGSNDDKRERLASPLILRPLACTNNKGIGMAVILDTPQTPPDGLLLDGENISNDPKPYEKLNQPEANCIEPLRRNTDVLEAFLKTVNNR